MQEKIIKDDILIRVNNNANIENIDSDNLKEIIESLEIAKESYIELVDLAGRKRSAEDYEEQEQMVINTAILERRMKDLETIIRINRWAWAELELEKKVVKN